MAITFYASVLIRHSFPLWNINYQTGIRACSFNYASFGNLNIYYSTVQQFKHKQRSAQPISTSLVSQSTV